MNWPPTTTIVASEGPDGADVINIVGDTDNGVETIDLSPNASVDGSLPRTKVIAIVMAADSSAHTSPTSTNFHQLGQLM